MAVSATVIESEKIHCDWLCQSSEEQFLKAGTDKLIWK